MFVAALFVKGKTWGHILNALVEDQIHKLSMTSGVPFRVEGKLCVSVWMNLTHVVLGRHHIARSTLDGALTKCAVCNCGLCGPSQKQMQVA